MPKRKTSAQGGSKKKAKTNYLDSISVKRTGSPSPDESGTSTVKIENNKVDQNSSKSPQKTRSTQKLKCWCDDGQCTVCTRRCGHCRGCLGCQKNREEKNCNCIRLDENCNHRAFNPRHPECRCDDGQCTVCTDTCDFCNGCLGCQNNV